jgi:hypothetical protein
VSILKNDTYIEMTTDTASILANGHNASPVSEVSDVVKKIIDQYQQEAINPIVNYSSTSIEDTGESMTYIFNTIFYNDAIDKCREASPTNWWWYVGADNILKYKPKPSRATHTFTFGKDFKNIKVEKNMENIINNVLFCSNNQNRQIVKRYQDVDSEDQFDDRWEIYTDSRVTQGTTADRMSNSELDAKKDAQVKVIIEIVDNNGANSGYDIESIEPGDTCKFVGFNDITSQTFTSNMQILSVDYTPDSVKLEIESLSPSIARENQENKRKIAEQQATGRASTFDTDKDVPNISIETESGNDYTSSTSYVDVMSITLDTVIGSDLLIMFQSAGWQNNTTDADSRQIEIWDDTNSAQISELHCVFPASNQYFKHNPNLFAIKQNIDTDSITLKIRQKSGNGKDGGFVSSRQLIVYQIKNS